MFRIGKLVLAGIIPLFLLSACFKTPSIVGIKQVKITGFTDSVVKATVAVDIKNENFFTLKVCDFRYAFGILKDTLGGGFIKEEMVLKKNAITKVEFHPEINFRKLTNLPDSIFYKDSIPLTFYLSGKFTFLKIRKTRTFTSYVKWQELMDALLSKSGLPGVIKIRSFGLKSLSLEKSQLNVDFDFDNFLPFKMTLDSFSVNVLSDLKSRKVVGNWSSVEAKEIPSRQVQTVSALITIQNISMLQSAFMKDFSGDFAYYLDGKAFLNVEGRKCMIPLRQRIAMNGER